MGGWGLIWIRAVGGVRDHIFRKVMVLGRRPALSTRPFFPQRPLFPGAGQRSTLLCSGETYSCVLGKRSGWAPLITPLTVVQLALTFVDKVPGPLHHAEALGRRWQSWTDILCSPTKSSEGFPLWVYKSPLSNSWLRELSLLARGFLSHILNNFSAIHYMGKQVLFVLILSLRMQLPSAKIH